MELGDLDLLLDLDISGSDDSTTIAFYLSTLILALIAGFSHISSLALWLCGPGQKFRVALKLSVIVCGASIILSVGAVTMAFLGKEETLALIILGSAITQCIALCNMMAYLVLEYMILSAIRDIERQVRFL